MLRSRRADMADAARLYGWRNDPQTRQHSTTTGDVSFLTHIAWMERTLSDERTELYVCYDSERSVTVGTFRLDVHDDAVEVSITVDPAQRGRGYAIQVLQEALEKYPAKRYTARVKENNYPSLRAFWAMGFRACHVDGDTLYLELACKS